MVWAMWLLKPHKTVLRVDLAKRLRVLTIALIGEAACLQSLTAADVIPQPIDQTELQVLNAKLDEYVSQFRDYRIELTNESLKKTAAGKIETVRRSHRDLLVAGRSSRGYGQELLSHNSDGRTVTDFPRTTSFRHNGEVTQIRKGSPTVIFHPGDDPHQRPILIFQVIGVVVPIYSHSKISDYIRESMLVLQYPDEMLLGRKTTVLSIGPPLPKANPDAASPEGETWFKLWISPQDHSCPLKMVVYRGFDQKLHNLIPDLPVQKCQNPLGETKRYMVETYEVLEMGEAVDERHKTVVPFPAAVSFVGGGIDRQYCHKMILNPTVSDSDFVAKIPDDEALMVDGRMVRLPLLPKGPTPQRLDSIQTEVLLEDAKDSQLSEVVSDHNTYGWMAVVSAVVCLGVIYWKFQQ